ncbi:MAG TPA: hypothetical protein VGF67_06425 [Ktedonobacteraceae bacterium]|jgi:hypothetical protein
MEQPSKTSPRNQRAKLAYDFFQQYEHTQQSFTPADLVQATGYQITTVKVYLSKKWWFARKHNGTYTVQGMAGQSFADFLRDLSQKAREPLPVLAPLWKQEPLTFPLVMAFISLCILWAGMLLFFRKRSWWIVPL